MFSINGTALDNETLGWVVLGDSSVITSITMNRTNLEVPLRDGSVPLPASKQAPVVPIAIETPRANQGILRALFDAPELVLTEEGQDGLEARVEVMSMSPTTYGPADEIVQLKVVLRIPGVYWRDDADATSTPAALGSGSVDIEVMAGLTAPVRDAVVRFKGGVTTPRITDGRGSWIEYGGVVASGHYLRIETATGRAFDTATNTWTGGTEVTGDINNGPGPYYLEITPDLTDPTAPVAALTVSSAARSGSPTVEVRGRRAYAV